MGYDYAVTAQSVTVNGPGGISSDYGTIKSDGILGQLSVGLLNIAQQTTSATSIATSGTIAVPGNGAIRVTTAGAVTGVILGTGSYGGQTLIIFHEGSAANTITFAAAGTSNVAGGASVSLAGLAAHIFVWNTKTSLWYQVGPATN